MIWLDFKFENVFLVKVWEVDWGRLKGILWVYYEYIARVYLNGMSWYLVEGEKSG